jgi:hypothetical protein
VETSATATAMEATATAVGTSALTMGIGRMWPTERGNAQQSNGGGCQPPAYPRSGSMFV